MADIAPFRYAAIDDLVRRFGQVEIIQLTDPDAVTINEDAAADALADAGAEIDLYLSGRYALPLATVPRVLVNISCDLARANLYADRITEVVSSRQSAARDLLKSLRDGKTSLGLDVAMMPVASTGGPQVSAAPRRFTDDSLADYGDAL